MDEDFEYFYGCINDKKSLPAKKHVSSLNLGRHIEHLGADPSTIPVMIDKLNAQPKPIRLPITRRFVLCWVESLK